MADYNSLYHQPLYLSPEQQDLLLAALSSNNPPQKQGTNNPSIGSHLNTESSHSTTNNNSPSQPQSNSFDPSSSTYFESPIQDAPGSGHLTFGSDESPFLDFDPEVDFDFQADQLIGDIPEFSVPTEEHESGEKRKNVEGKDEETETGKKRRESEEKDKEGDKDKDKDKGEGKTAKKPGRKPLTSEPTSKRKAQNRAAQRAFRERKEKHLRDLENKVQELQKASEAANQENSQLRLQVERLQVELREYRKRLSWLSSGNGFSTMSALHNVNSRNLSGLSNNDFFFDFPKFGDLPGNHIFSNGSLAKSMQNKPNGTSPTAGSAPSSSIPGVLSRGSLSSVGGSSQQTSTDRTASNGLPNGLPNVSQGSKDAAASNGSSQAGSGSNASSNYTSTTSTGNGVNGTSNYRSQVPGSSAASNSDSPSASSESQHGQASSMGTSPEPSLNSPSVSKPNDSGAENSSSGDQGKSKKCTIDGEKSFCEQLSLACGNINDPVPAVLKQSNNNNSRMPGQYQNNAPDQSLSFDWLAQQNGGNFDPVLFNDYREPQEAVLSQDFGTFFNDAFPLPDLGSPFHNFNDVASPKKDLVAEIDNKLDDDEEVVPGEDKSQMMDCTKIWDRLQSMEKFRNGEIDVDSLCTELRTKARCSEGGVVVNKKDVDDIMGRVQ
ncbi:hypothetical protein VTN77DRAFT_6600 [Rasamsonia byssochlamydoides]|uniref:uncharacterized protein n=1 Tax=Rasamsonia byssochlamydoides TaxID=89139 RepID=UPI0037436DEE